MRVVTRWTLRDGHVISATTWKRENSMIIAMLIALAQMAFIPGFLISGVLLPRAAFFEKVIFSFPLSLLFNYVLVALLVIAGIYKQELLWLVIGVEGLALYWVCRKNRQQACRDQTIGTFCSKTMSFQRAALDEMTVEAAPMQKLLLWGAYSMALLAIGVAFKLFVGNLGSIFLDNDAVAAYNKWAEVIATGKLSPSSYYPLLIPANWSLAYVLQGAPLQFSAKAVMPLFFLNTLVAYLHLGLVKRSPAYLFAVPLIACMFLRYLPGYIVEGSMDVAVASICALSTYAMLCALGSDSDAERNHRFLLVAGVLSIEAALVKQSGLFFAAIFPVLCIVVARQLGGRRIITAALVVRYILGLLVLAMSFYVYRWILIKQGADTSYVNWLVGGIHEGRNLGQRLVFAWHLVANDRYTRGGAIGMVCLLIVSLWHKPLRWLNLLIFVPFTIIWATAFSYDIRNWAIGMMFLAITAAGGAEILWRRLTFRALLGIKIKYVVSALAVSFFVLVAVGQSTISRERLQKLEAAKMRQIGIPDLNEKVFAYIDTHNLDGKVLTTYNYFKLMPGVGEKFTSMGLNLVADSDLKQFKQKMQDPAIGYLLVPSLSSMRRAPVLRAAIQSKINTGDYQVIFNNQRLFVKKRGVALPKNEQGK